MTLPCCSNSWQPTCRSHSVAALTATSKKVGGCGSYGGFLSTGGWYSARNGLSAWLRAAKNSIPWQLLLDARAQVQQDAHEHHLPLQSVGPQNGSDGGKHLGRIHEGHGLGHLMGGMANVVYCSSDNLFNNNYYFALSTPASCNLPHRPSSHTGIANFGTSGFYFSSSTPISNLNPQAPTVGVRVANGLPVVRHLLWSHLFPLHPCRAV